MSNPTYFVQECPTCGRRLADSRRASWPKGCVPALPGASDRRRSRQCPLRPCGVGQRLASPGRRIARIHRPAKTAAAIVRCAAACLRLRRRQLLQVPKEPRIRLRRAAGVSNHHAGNRQPDQRQAHRHPMVVVGVDLRAVQRAGRDPQPVGPLLDLGPELSQLDRQGVNPVGFLVANMGDAADRRRPIGEQRHRCRASARCR